MKQTGDGAESVEKTRPGKSTEKHASSPSEGTSWQLYFVMAVILIGVVGIVARVLGLF